LRQLFVQPQQPPLLQILIADQFRCALGQPLCIFAGSALTGLTHQISAGSQRQRNILKKRNQELKRQEKLRDELYRMLIHDLKAPLAEVVANLDIMSYSITGDSREFLESAQIGCDRTVSIVFYITSQP